MQHQETEGKLFQRYLEQASSSQCPLKTPRHCWSKPFRVSNTLITFGSVNRCIQDLLGSQSGSVDQWSIALSRSLVKNPQTVTTTLLNLYQRTIGHQIRHQTLGSWKNPNLQMHDNVAMNAINEIAKWTSQISRQKPGKELLVQDLLSRPFNSSGSAYQVLLTMCQEECGSFCSYMPPMSSGQTEPNGQGWSWMIPSA